MNAPNGIEPQTFSGTERFHLVRALGRGGMGAVYEVVDTRRNVRVALKTLLHLDPSHLYILKQEFRSLAGITHPNLVTLYEMFHEEGQWFFTMQFVEGVNFLDWVSLGEAEMAATVETPTPQEGEPEVTRTILEQRPEAACNVKRLIAAARQLAEAVHALHSMGKLHRDLKSSNVLVDGSGRVVVLDFGLVAEIGSAIENPGAGTPGYVSPEQLFRKPLTPASDWYSLGVLLYRALTGEMPRGTSRPSLCVEGVPPQLDRLCEGLLQPRPEDRPSPADILTALGAAAPAYVPAAGGPDTIFLGRERDLATLRAAHQLAAAGKPVVVMAHGQSGIGKSSLIRHFLAGLRDDRGVTVLSGRCHEQEAVSGKAVDTLVDSLSRALSTISTELALTVAPRDLSALIRMFPVLGRVPALVAIPLRPLVDVPEFEIRRRGVAALREVLARLGDRTRVVVWIDDLQWGDTESAAILIDLLRPPDAPALLLIASYRSEESGRSACLGALNQAWGDGEAVEHIDLAVGPLSPDESRAVAAAYMGAPGSEAADIASEGHGNPYFIAELARRGHAPQQDQALTLDALLWQRVERLPENARWLLEAIAVCGCPLQLEEACRAAGLSPLDFDASLALRSAQLGRSIGADSGAIEVYHDRVRESVIAHLPAVRIRERQRSLAITLEAAEQPPHELLGSLFEGAGEPAKAAQYYAAAADEAAGKLAFERAAGLFQKALQFGAAGTDAHALERKRALALANAGWSAEAAGLCRQLAESGPPEFRQEMQELAAYYFAISGHTGEGKAAFEKVLRRVGLSLPRTPLRALASLTFDRLRASMHGARFQRRNAAEVAPELLRQIDVAWSVASGVGFVDIFAGAALTARSLRLALKAGEPFRVARSLAWDGATRGLNASSRKQSARMVADAAAIAETVDSAYLRGLIELARALNEYNHCRFAESYRLAGNALRILKQECPSSVWEINTANSMLLQVMALLGKYSEMRPQVAEALEDARRRGDLYTATVLGVYNVPILELVDGRPEAALRKIDQALAEWNQTGFYSQKLLAVLLVGTCHLYTGDGQKAWDWVNEQWPFLKKNFLFFLEIHRINMVFLRARAAALLAMQSSDPRPYLRCLDGDVKSLLREKSAVGIAMGRAAEALLTGLRGDRPGAAAQLIAAAALFRDLSMTGFEMSLRFSAGILAGGAQGQAWNTEAAEWQRQAGIRDSLRTSAQLVPILHKENQR
ncbi:MAG TPA: protein kinase [Bryobacteraceae bacterium]|nr:protein kinase [Bryobacteraceae bacterium]